MSPASAAPQPTTDAGRTALERILSEPERALLAFDFDGTLAPIVADPTTARAHPEAVPRLAELGRRVGRIAVITGRPAAVAVDYAGLAGVPGLERLVVLGHYGLERWDATTGRVAAPPPHPGVAAAREALPAMLAELGVPDGVWIEDKGAAVALHTRRTADPAAVVERLRVPVGQLAADHGLDV
ncbi:MAG: trehalose-phosphatase, partial [Actinomycetota bacterium]|nr:trehalose-phosphatase [Actinomycetota bacterium]